MSLDTGSSQALSSGFDQQLANARSDNPTHLCSHNLTSKSGIAYCEDGDVNGKTSVLLIGDSHAGHWQKAFAAAAKTAGVRFYGYWLSRCPAMAVPIATKVDQNVLDPTCPKYRQDAASLMQELHPTAVVLSNSQSTGQAIVHAAGITKPALARQWGRAYEDYLRSLAVKGIKVGRVVGTPQLPSDPIECLARTKSLTSCDVPAADAYAKSNPYLKAEAAAAKRVGNVLPFDINGQLCPRRTCSMVQDDTLVYVDPSHLSTAYTTSFEPQIAVYLAELTGS